MRPRQVNLLLCYSLSQSIAVAATVFAYSHFTYALLAGVLVLSFTFWSLAAIALVTEENNPYLIWSEKIAMFGIIIFLPLIFIFDILFALLALIFCAVFAINFQLFDFRRLYVGLAASLMGICVGAAHTKSGSYFLFFYLYMPVAALVLAHAFLGQQHTPPKSISWRSGSQFRVIGLLLASASLIYLFLPRLPAGNLGGHPGSDVFYRENDWENQARQGLEGESLEQALRQLADTKSAGEGEQPGDAAAASDPYKTSEQTEHAQSAQHTESTTDALDLTGSNPAKPLTSNPIIAYMTAAQPLYLRSEIYDVFDGLRWSSTSNSSIKLKVDRSGLVLRQPGQNVARVSYDLELTARLPAAVPLAAVPSHVYFPSTALSIDKFGQLRAPGPLAPGTRYSAEAVLSHIQGRVFSELTWHETGQYLQLPAALDPRIHELGSKLASKASSQLAAALNIEEYLRSHYQYSFDSIFTSPGVTPLKEFLFETQKGHCEYFASALVVLLRTQNIPARLITGFSASQQNPLTGLYEIHVLDSHAWVEAYVDQIGWVQLEPTPYFELPQLAATPLSVELINRYVERQQKTLGAMPAAEPSWHDRLMSIWQTSAVAAVSLLAYSKLFWLRTWLVWVLVAAMGVIGYFMWKKIKPARQINQLFYAAMKGAKENPDGAMDIYLAAIEGMLTLVQMPRAPGVTIEQYTFQLQQYFSEIEAERMCDTFNLAHYQSVPSAPGAKNLDANDYAQLLVQMYKLGFKGMVNMREMQ